MLHQHKQNRNAVTLIELLLVLAILVAIAGIAAPTFDSMISSRRLPQSITRLRNEIMAARVTAMRTGQAQVMRATLQGNQYSIVPWLGGTEAQDSSAGATVMNAGGQIVDTDSKTGAAIGPGGSSTETKELDEGVRFLTLETLVDTRNALAVQTTTGTLPASGGSQGTEASGLSSPLLIYPDGSSTTAQIVLVDTRGRRMGLQMRGVTGQLITLQLISVDPSSLPQAP